MLTNNRNLKGFVIRATDGEIGTVEDLYFDDEMWAIRYLTVETGNWLDGRKVLISPPSILNADESVERIDVSLTRMQIENSPDIDTRRPVSRQHEAEYFSYYGYPYYWDGPFMWGPAYYPAGLPFPAGLPRSEVTAPLGEDSSASHLRSTEAVTGYQIGAADGEIGHVARFIVDDETWMIRYLEVATTNWWPGKTVLLPPSLVQRISWDESKVFVGLTREAIQGCPAYDASMPISREYENMLYVHYGSQPYWTDKVKSASALPLLD